MNTTDEKQTRDYLRYRLHHKLKLAGNTVYARMRWVVKREKEVSEKEMRWLNILAAIGYCVSDGMFIQPQN